MLENFENESITALQACLSFLHLLLSFCFVALLEVLDISPLP
jgi:hypothetical protein